ncbi:MAG: hypothetical protein QOI52_169, partial [Chloroflexota bacterium]|nr:hypothetical protein [Chloroflexota bacterium]
VEADIMLGFFFPGAVLPDMVEHGARPPAVAEPAPVEPAPIEPATTES